MSENNPFRPPTDEEIAAAETRFGFPFHPDYREFLQSGGEVADACFEPAVILPGSGHLDLFDLAEGAWNEMGLPRHLLPFVEDNGDYYCLNAEGEVIFWSHSGSTHERWASLAEWHQRVCVEGQ